MSGKGGKQNKSKQKGEGSDGATSTGKTEKGDNTSLTVNNRPL